MVLPLGPPKRIVVFTSKDSVMQKNLRDLRVWLRDCGYPERVINEGIHNAQLQGPAPPKSKSKVIPLVTTYYDNYNNGSVLQVAKNLLQNPQDERLKSAFENVTFINAYKQPPNLLRSLSHSRFLQVQPERTAGVFKCLGPKCKICRLYIQVGNQVLMSDGSTWEVKCFANCNSLNILYFLVCNFCNVESYIGKTDDCRERTNNHMTGCRYGKSTNIFDKHVFGCAKERGMDLLEPYFKLYILMVCNNYHKLLSYESALHARGLDTLNNPHLLAE